MLVPGQSSALHAATLEKVSACSLPRSIIVVQMLRERVFCAVRCLLLAILQVNVHVQFGDLQMPLEGPGFAYLCLDYTAQQDRCAVWAGSVVARVVYTCDMPPETAV